MSNKTILFKRQEHIQIVEAYVNSLQLTATGAIIHAIELAKKAREFEIRYQNLETDNRALKIALALAYKPISEGFYSYTLTETIEGKPELDVSIIKKP